MKKQFTIPLVAIILLLTGCTDASDESIKESELDLTENSSPEVIETPETELPDESPEPINSDNQETMSDFDQKALPEKGEEIVVMETSMGTLKIRLFPEFTPKTVENFVGLAKKGYYDGLTFHRVMENFMIQGGDPTGTGAGGESLWGGKFEKRNFYGLEQSSRRFSYG